MSCCKPSTVPAQASCCPPASAAGGCKPVANEGCCKPVSSSSSCCKTEAASSSCCKKETAPSSSCCKTEVKEEAGCCKPDAASASCCEKEPAPSTSCCKADAAPAAGCCKPRTASSSCCKTDAAPSTSCCKTGAVPASSCCKPVAAPSACAPKTASGCCGPKPSNATHDAVRSAYGSAVTSVVSGGGASCCGSKATELSGVDPITKDLYNELEASEVPAEALLASFGCGNPTALAKLEKGQTVLDLGSGGGIDVILSAKRVGPTGKAYGLDMTDEMLDLARRNAVTAKVDNVEFLKGHIEQIPLPDCSVDVIISNCVINLSPDKDATLAEAYRVLKPGGRLAISDIVLNRPLPTETQQDLKLWAGCIAGALVKGDYEEKLTKAGFKDIDIEPTRVYSSEDAKEIVDGQGDEKDEQLKAIDGAAMSCFIRATKPTSNCGQKCC